MNFRLPELDMPLKNKPSAALDEADTHLEQSGHLVQAEGPHVRCSSAAHWAGRLLNRWSKEFSEVQRRSFRRGHKWVST